MLKKSNKRVLLACFCAVLIIPFISTWSYTAERLVLFPCTISGYAFDDVNDNGQLDTQESGIENISVTLTKIVFMLVFLPVSQTVNDTGTTALIHEIGGDVNEAGGHALFDMTGSDNRSVLMSKNNVFLFFSFVPVRIDSTVTDANGRYLFENVRSGLYKIEAMQSTGTHKRALRKVGLLNNDNLANFAFNAVQSGTAISFTADPESITEGNEAILQWNVENADSVTIDNGIGQVDALSGSITVYPSKTTTYTLTATNGSDQYTSTVTVTVTKQQPIPAEQVGAMIHIDPQKIQKGASCILTWDSENAQDVAIDQGANQVIQVSESGIMKIYPKETTTYTIIATGYDGSVATDNTTVQVYEADGEYASGKTPDNQTDDSGGGQDSGGDDESEDPTLVTLNSFSAARSAKTVHIYWTTASEIHTIGFNIYYADSFDGEYIRANESIVAAVGSAVTGADYEYAHELTENPKSGTLYYILEEIDSAGNASWHGPVKAVY